MSVPDDRAQFVKLAFSAQAPLRWIEAELAAVEEGSVTISFAVRDDLCTAGTGVVMGGITALVADVAAGLSLLTRLNPPRPVVTTSFSSHQITPAKGDRIVCIGSVLKAGKTQGLSRAEVYAETGGDRRHVATLTATFAIP